MPDVYIARKRLKVGDKVVMPGDEVPEAVTWRNLHSYLASGAVNMVQAETTQGYPINQSIPTDEALDWKSRQVPGHRHQMHGWVAYGQTGELPDGGGSGGDPVLTLTFPASIDAANAVMTEFETELANTGGEVDDCAGQWTITPGDSGIKAADVTVNMVDFNGPGEDVLINFQDAGGVIVGGYGPFPCAAGMSGATSDQIVIDSDWVGSLDVKVEIYGGDAEQYPDALATATFTLNLNAAS